MVAKTPETPPEARKATRKRRTYHTLDFITGRFDGWNPIVSLTLPYFIINILEKIFWLLSCCFLGFSHVITAFSRISVIFVNNLQI